MMGSRRLGFRNFEKDADRLDTELSAADGFGGWLNKIYLIPSGTGALQTFAKTSAGVDAASAASSAGDVLYFPDGTYSGDHIFTDVELWGAGRDKTILTGKMTLVGDAVPNNLSVVRTANDANDLIAVQVSANESPTGFGCDFLATQSGAGDAYGVYVEGGSGQPRFEYCYIDGQSTGGSGHGVFQADPGPGPVTMTNVGWCKDPSTPTGGSLTFDGLGQFSIIAPRTNGNADHGFGVVFNLDMGAFSFSAGALKIYFDVTEFTSAVDIGMGNGGVPTDCDAGYTPELHGTGTPTNVSGVGSYSQTWGSANTFQDGYFSFSVRSFQTNQWTTSVEITKIVWIEDGDPTENDLWEPNVETTAVTKLRWSKINGSTTDLTSAGGEIHVIGNDFDNSSVSGTIVYLEGDRGAFDVANYPALHASDFAAGDSHHAAVTLAADADALLGLTGQQVTLDTQTANTVLAGPTSGAAADPTFRALVAADIPNIPVSTADVTNPPTDAELDSEFGTPATVGAGFFRIVDDNGGGTDEYLVWSDGTNWFYVTGTKAT